MQSESTDIRCANRHAMACAFIAIVIFIIVSQITGRIPVAQGAGWDGALYLRYVQTIAAGSFVDTGPYHLSRMLGFAPALIAALGGLKEQGLLLFQSILNSVMLAISLGMFLRLLLDWGLSKSAAWIATSCLGLSWSWLIMPVFYPMLSDHTALVVSVLSMWVWNRNRPDLLAILAFASVWIMPGLLLVPMLLACAPMDPNSSVELKSTLRPMFRWMLQILIALPLIAVCVIAFHIEDAEITTHPKGLDVAWLSLKYISMTCLLLSVVAIWLAWTRLFTQRWFWSKLSLQGMIWTIGASAFSLLLLVFILDWDSGFRGPPILHNMLLQSLAAPFKPLVANFLYFGPILPLAIASVLRWSIAIPKSKLEPHLGLAVVILAFLPFLLMGSESRQWAAVFPVSVAWLAVRLRSEWRLLPFAVMAVVMLIPAAAIKPTLAQAVISQLPLSHPDWQVYFGRLGPWMSRESYFNGVIALSSFVLVLFAIKRSWRIFSLDQRHN
ncbi:hypothetical protein [Hydrogenophaga sp. ZJX-1]|uniref:hypothetical protein n=1 Tax=Hydrogenophaga sp. ZJX-1 TaxID=3404778 RepID=UPI003B287AEA